jgi:hypothetical protein
MGSSETIISKLWFWRTRIATPTLRMLQATILRFLYSRHGAVCTSPKSSTIWTAWPKTRQHTTRPSKPTIKYTDAQREIMESKLAGRLGLHEIGQSTATTKISGAFLVNTNKTLYQLFRQSTFNKSPRIWARCAKRPDQQHQVGWVTMGHVVVDRSVQKIQGRRMVKGLRKRYQMGLWWLISMTRF